jgi:hypothetical protein
MIIVTVCFLPVLGGRNQTRKFSRSMSEESSSTYEAPYQNSLFEFGESCLQSYHDDVGPSTMYRVWKK